MAAFSAQFKAAVPGLVKAVRCRCLPPFSLLLCWFWIAVVAVHSTRGTENERVMRYENQLRASASLRKLFKYFSSVTVDGRDLMTPLDFVRSITPCVPSNPDTLPLNYIKRESSRKGEALSSSKRTADPAKLDFFSFGDSSNPSGLISFGRFLVFMTILSIPEKDLEMAFRIFDKDRLNKITATEFDRIMANNPISSNEGYRAIHSQHSIVRVLFGPKLDKELSYHSFCNFHKQLRAEVTKLQFQLYNPRKEDNTISARNFAYSIAAVLNPAYRSMYMARVSKMPADEDHRISFQDFANTKKILVHIEHMDRAVKKYLGSENFTKENFPLASYAVAGVDISPNAVDVIFSLFDMNNDGMLDSEETVAVMKGAMVMPKVQTNSATDPTQCISNSLSSCKKCLTEWYNGGQSTSGEGEGK